METVFVDTGAWVALADRSDAHHKEAVEALLIIQDRCRLLTTNLVIAETYILIRRNLGFEAGIRFLDSVQGSPRTTKLLSDESLEKAATDTLRKYNDQDFSYTDAVSFEVMKRHGIERAFSFDRHFHTAGFSLLP
jgi:hypothetical protein